MMKAKLFQLFLTIEHYILLALVALPRYKMRLAGKSYAKKYPQGSITPHAEFKNFDYQILNGKKIILFLVYEPKSVLFYEYYFNLLRKLDSEIIVIANGKLPDDFIKRFGKECLFVAERFNIGRDFGAYKEFMVHLIQKNIYPESILFCNDSIFANLRPDDDRFITFMKSNAEEDFVGAAEYYGRPNYHIQSYFLKFSKNVMQGKNFREFWQNFFISDDRRRNIYKGEIALSQAIFKDGFLPKVFLNSDNIIQQIVDDEEILARFLVEISSNKHLKAAGYHFRKDYLAMLDKDILPKQYRLMKEKLKIDIAAIVNLTSMISVTPFLIIDLFGFPFLKRDLIYHEIIDWMLIRQFGENFDKDLLQEYINDQRLKKRPWHLKFMQKLMFRIGVI